MELTLVNLYFARFIMILGFVASIIWMDNSKKSKPSQCTNLTIAIFTFAVEIPILINEVSLGKNYEWTILGLLFFSVYSMSAMFFIGKEMGKKDATKLFEKTCADGTGQEGETELR